MIHFDPLSFLLGASVASGLLFTAFVIHDAWRKHMGHHKKAGKYQYINWSLARPGYDWVAVDSDGQIAIYDAEPIQSEYMWICSSGTEHGFDMDDYLPKSAIIGPLPPWRESLRHRPGK